MKKCNKCGIEKPISQFAKDRTAKDGLQKSCRSCQKEYHRLYYLGHKEGCRRRHKRWSTKNPEQKRQLSAKSNKKRYYIKNYGITNKEYEAFMQKQHSECAICGVHQSELKKTLHVDHCHKTNRVRGLLCLKCNTAIGFLDDSPALLSKALDYLMNL